MALISGKDINMTEGKMGKAILLFALPLIASNLLQMLFNTADMIVVGRWAENGALAAVGSTMPLTSLFIELFLGLAMGANVVAANHIGANDRMGLGRIANTAVWSGLISGFLVMALGFRYVEPMLVAMQTPADVLPLSVVYLKIYFCGMPFLMLYDFGASLLRARGDTTRPMYFMMFSGGINLALNCLFVIVFHWSVAGVAFATVISEALSAVLVLWALVTDSHDLSFRRANGFLDYGALKDMFRIGLPAGIQGILFAISNILIQSAMNSFGSDVMAGNAAIVSLSNFIYLGMSAFYTAALSFSGQNYGAKQYRRIDQSMFICLAYVFCIGTFGALLLWLFANPLLSLYSDSDVIKAAAMLRLKYGIVFYGLLGTMEVIPATLRGMNISVLPTIVTLLGCCAFRIFWIETVFVAHPTQPILHLSSPISWIITTAVHVICYIVIRRKMTLNSSHVAM